MNELSQANGRGVRMLRVLKLLDEPMPHSDNYIKLVGNVVELVVN